MKTIQLFTLVLALSFTTSLLAQDIITVNNTPESTADYDSFQDAIDAATDGDIIMVYGSGTSYGKDTIDKQLVIMGPGYFLGQNPAPNTQANTATARLDNLVIESGGSGSIITGMHLYFTYSGSGTSAALQIEGTNNITIEHNYIYASSSLNSYTIRSIYITNSSNITLNNNYIHSNNSGSGYGYCINSTSSTTGVNIKNNILTGERAFSVHNATITNNVITASLNAIVNSYFANNIITNAGNFSSTTNSTITHNMKTDDDLGTAGGNQANVDMSTVFVGYPDLNGYSEDGRWQLKANSPAIGAGVGGVDCGIFGGDEPYTLSGIPKGPNIYELNVPQSGTSGGGINVHIKVKANN